MPSRILRESFVTSLTVASLPTDVQDRLPRYFLLPDDFGCFLFLPQVIAGRIWPLRPDMTPDRIAADVEAIAKAGILELYAGPDGKRYGWFPNWETHQRKPREQSARHFPAPPANAGKLPPNGAGGGSAGISGNRRAFPTIFEDRRSKIDKPPLPPVNGGRTPRNLPRLKKRQKRATTLAEDLRFQLEAQRDAWSRALHRALKSEPGMSREDQIAWVERRCVGADGQRATNEQAEDIVGLVETSMAGARA